MSPQFTRPKLLTCATCALLGMFALPVAAQDTPASEASDDDEEAAIERAPVCDTQIKVGATIYMHDQPARSMAMLRTPKAGVAGVYRRGMFVEGFLVIAVEPRGVLLQRDGAYCWLRLQPDPSRPNPQPPPPKKRPKRKR